MRDLAATLTVLVPLVQLSVLVYAPLSTGSSGTNGLGVCLLAMAGMAVAARDAVTRD